MSVEDLWYRNAIIYCLDVEKYMDATGPEENDQYFGEHGDKWYRVGGSDTTVKRAHF